MARALKIARGPRKNKTKHGFSFFEIFPDKNFIDFPHAHNAKSLVSVSQAFMRRDKVTRVTSHLSETRSSHVLNNQECLKRQSSSVNSFLLYFI